MFILNQSSDTIFVDEYRPWQGSALTILSIDSGERINVRSAKVYHIHSGNRGSAVVEAETGIVVTFGNLKIKRDKGDKDYIIIT